MALTKLQVEHAKPRAKAYKMFDGRGLYLEVSPSGARGWRFKYRIGGKEKRISLGVYPDVGLKDARDRLDEVRKQVAANIDPGERRKAEKAAIIEKVENTFEAIAREWFTLHSPKWAASPRRQDHPAARAQCLSLARWQGDQVDHRAGVARRAPQD